MAFTYQSDEIKLQLRTAIGALLLPFLRKYENRAAPAFKKASASWFAKSDENMPK